MPEEPARRIGCKRHGEVRTDGCHYCMLYWTHTSYRQLWGGRIEDMLPPSVIGIWRKLQQKNGPTVTLPSPPRGKDSLPCQWEGEIVDWCTSCTGPKAELKHERLCLHPSEERERCVRHNPMSNLQSCSTCLQRVPTMRWSYGVTTVESRRRSLLPRTLASLKAAGFDRPHLFVDGGKDSAGWEKEFGLTVTLRGGDPVRTAGAWVLSLYELYCREPSADRFAVFQDDLITYRGLREYLTKAPYPTKGYCNLYTFPSNEKLVPMGTNGKPRSGWFRSAQNGRGAVGLVFDREAVVELLSSRHMAERPQDAHRGHRSIDGGILESMRKAGWTEYCHWPSLVQHEGEVSSMGNKPHKRSECFRGEEFDVVNLLLNTESQR